MIWYWRMLATRVTRITEGEAKYEISMARIVYKKMASFREMTVLGMSLATGVALSLYIFAASPERVGMLFRVPRCYLLMDILSTLPGIFFEPLSHDVRQSPPLQIRLVLLSGQVGVSGDSVHVPSSHDKE